MERRAKNLVLVLLLLSCLLVYHPSPLPPASQPVFLSSMPRSLCLGIQQKLPTTLKITSSQEMVISAGINLGKPPRMDFEVDDYPPPDHNHHHGPGH